MTLRGLIFDKDGTLIDIDQTWRGVAADVIAEVARNETERLALFDLWGVDAQTGAFLPHSPVIAGSNWDLAERAHQVRRDMEVADLDALLAEHSAKVVPLPVVPLVEPMDRLSRAGLKLAVMTNDVEVAARAHLSAIEMVDAFDPIVGSDSGHGQKPDPAPLLAVAQIWGLAASDVAMVGDSTHDLLAGRAAGMTTIAVLTGPAEREELAPFADHVCASVADIPDLLALD